MFQICKRCHGYVFKIMFLPYYWHKWKSHVHFCWDPSLVRNKDKSKGNELWSFKLDKKKACNFSSVYDRMNCESLLFPKTVHLKNNFFKEPFSDFLALFGRTFKRKLPSWLKLYSLLRFLMYGGLLCSASCQVVTPCRDTGCYNWKHEARLLKLCCNVSVVQKWGCKAEWEPTWAGRGVFVPLRGLYLRATAAPVEMGLSCL